MTTIRYYLSNAAAAVSPAYAAVWTGTGTRIELPTTPPSLSGTFNVSENSAAPISVPFVQAVAAGLASGRSLSGTMRAAFWISTSGGASPGAPTGGSAQARLRIVLKVVSSDGATLRGVLGQFDSTVLIFNNTNQCVRTVAGTLSNVDAQTGDRVVAEVGVYYNNTITSSLSAGITPVNVGATVDQPYTDGDTTSATRRSWIELILNDPPAPPTGLTQTGATPVSVDVAWTAPATGETPTSYEVRVDGGTPVDVGLDTSHTIESLTPSTTYTVEVRSVAATGTSTWASVAATTDDVSGEGIELEAGHTYGTQLLDDTYSITIRRGVRTNGVTDDLDPATATVIIKGSETLSPVTNDDVRPGRPIRLRGTLDGGATWTTVWTGEILRSRLEHDPDEKDDDAAYRLILTAVDLVTDLTGIPADTAIAGNLHQRVDHVLEPTGRPYTVDDPSTPTAAVSLPTNARDVLGQLRLIRDTAHALMYVNRDGELVAVADNARPRVTTVPDWTATDDTATTGIHYTQIDPAFDTDAVVNVLTIELLDGDENPATIWTDEDSRDDWGDKAQTVTVNDGVPETHAGLYLASRVDPALIPESISFVVQRRLDQAIEPTVDATHLTAAVGLELYDVIRVERNGIDTVDLLVRELTHVITPSAWQVTVGLRVPEVLATRWDDVPSDLTWDDVPPDLTWNAAVNWHPYL